VTGGDDAVAEQILSEGDSVNGVKAATELESTESAIRGDEIGRKLLVVVIADEVDGPKDPDMRGGETGGRALHVL